MLYNVQKSVKGHLLISETLCFWIRKKADNEELSPILIGFPYKL
jgi:hypothetical protein